MQRVTDSLALICDVWKGIVRQSLADLGGWIRLPPIMLDAMKPALVSKWKDIESAIGQYMEVIVSC